MVGIPLEEYPAPIGQAAGEGGIPPVALASL